MHNDLDKEYKTSQILDLCKNWGCEDASAQLLQVRHEDLRIHFLHIYLCNAM